MAELLKCEAVNEALPAYLAGELPPELHYAVDAHLGACSACAAREAEERELNHVLRSSLTEDSAGAARLEQKIRVRLSSPLLDPPPQPKPQPLLWRWRWAISSVAAVLVLTAALYLPGFIKVRI